MTQKYRTSFMLDPLHEETKLWKRRMSYKSGNLTDKFEHQIYWLYHRTLKKLV